MPEITNGTTYNSSHANGTSKRSIPSRLYHTHSPPALSDFKALCSRSVTQSDYPLSIAVESNIPIYDLSQYSPSDAQTTTRLQDAWYHILHSGPGVFVVRSLCPDTSLLSTVNSVYASIIASEKTSTKGDHFASSGKNDRIWNSFGKHGLVDSSSFLQYYSNPWLPLLFSAWLGPAYRVTAQVNIVKPGGAPQVSHRDYHLGFQTAEDCARFPKAMQHASQLLTLQGAVAHSDMPLESGPTRFLPFSQTFEEGYMAYRLPEFNDYFLEHWVSLPLRMGDGVFFSPGLMHAAGENRTQDVERSANLLQISSAFGKTMETVDSAPLVEKCWAGLREMYRDGKSEEVEAFVAAVTEGYPFPTNLDRRPPAPGGMAPESEQDILRRGLKEDWSTEDVMVALAKIREDSKA